MIKIINSVSNNNALRRNIFNQYTKCGDVCVNDDSSDAFLLCSFCASTPEDGVFRTLEKFIEHIKWHRSEFEPSSIFETIVTDYHEMLLLPEGDPIDVKLDPEPESTVDECEDDDDIFSHIPDECLGKIIDLFKKCPCLWHSVTAESEKKYIDPAKDMITKYFNKLTKRTESVEYVEEFLEKIKSEFLKKCTDEEGTSNQCLDELNFLLTSEMSTLDQSIYSDFLCTICNQRLDSLETLWDHLYECHMEIEDNDLSSIDLSTEERSDSGEKNSATEDKTGVDSPEYVAEFIETYRNNPRLWNRNHPQYTNRRLRQKSYDALLAVMKKYDNDATHHKVLAKIRCYRTQFIYAKRKIHEFKAQDCVYTPSIWYYENLLFLEGKTWEKKPKIDPPSEYQTPSAQQTATISTACTACDKKFTSLMECLDHMQNFHDSSAFQSSDGFFYCPICNNQSKTNASFIRHLRHNHSSTFKTCEDCGTKYRSMSALIRHRAQDHEDFNPYKCPHCRKGFTNLNRMKVHSATHSDVEDRRHVCQVCGSKFADKTNLIVHVRRHTRAFKIRCKICDHKVATTTELQSHMISHTKAYPCICDICGKRCRNKRILTLHQEELHGDEKYPCVFCDKKFKSERKLQAHYDSHKTVADQECHICRKKFFRVRSLQDHLRRKHKSSIKKNFLNRTKEENGERI